MQTQRKIFSRWVNQKVSRVTGRQVDDCVVALQDGITLIVLLEVLSEKKCTAKINRTPKMRPQVIENAGQAIQFAKECGVQTKLWPSPTDIVDGKEQQVLGFIWAIMLRFMKFTDEEGGSENLNAKDSLMMWCQNVVRGCPEVKLENWKSSWADGLALCAIIHKYRPNLIDWEGMDKSNKKANIMLAMDAAYKYFMLEKYITPEEFLKLDENSMVVYVSEYYYGIAEQRKLDLAARRIGKVIKLTKNNDAMREEYNASASKLKQRILETEERLSKIVFDNTMAGVRSLLSEFYEYKATEKNTLLLALLEQEALYNKLATVLIHNNRPPFTPAQGCSIKDLSAAMVSLEKAEQTRKVSLHAELNRQLKLQKLNEHHEKRANKIEAWIAAKQEYLSTPPAVSSSSTAQLQLYLLQAFDKELAQISTTSVKPLVALGNELKNEHFEAINLVDQREAAIQQGLQGLRLSCEALKPVLVDLCEIYDYQAWVKDALVGMEDVLFGFTLEEVTEFATTLDKIIATIAEEASKKAKAFKDYKAHMDSYPPLDTEYKNSIIALVDSINQDLEMGMMGTKAVYDAELEMQKEKDSKCKQFADVAEPLVAWILKQKEVVTSSTASLEEQLVFIEDRLSSLDQDGASLPDIAAAFTAIEESNITDIRHTTLTLRDVEVLWQQWQSFLEKKRDMLQSEIERSKKRGVTAEQLEEIQSNFTQYDKDNDGILDAKSLKACLYSLGEEKTGKEVDALIAQHGSSGGMSLEQFRNFMIGLLAVNDTQDDILYSFKRICRSDVALTVKLDHLASVMAPHDLQYIQSTAPQVKPNEYDYVSWTNSVFSR